MGLAAFRRSRRIKAARIVEQDTQQTEVRPYTDYTAEEIKEMNAKEQKAFIEQHALTIDGYKSFKAPELEEALLAFLGFSEASNDYTLVGEEHAPTDN